MPITRKKKINTVFKNEDDLDSETEKIGDFSDSGSDAHISEHSSSEDNEEYSSEEFDEKSNSKNARKKKSFKKPKFAKAFISKLSKPLPTNSDSDEFGDNSAPFSIRDMSEADKLLPSILNLSESDSSDDETSKLTSKKQCTTITAPNKDIDSENDNECKVEYQDVWSNNVQDNGDEIAKKTFLELEKHKARIDETKASVQRYSKKKEKDNESDVKNLLAQGEEIIPQQNLIKKEKKRKGDSDSEIEDWEEVKESKAIPQQGIQLIVEFPNTACRKTKKLDVEMMMKRKINRVKKEYQVHMHKVHVLCWLGYGNYVSSVVNDQDILSAALSLVPSKECYPGERVDIKYVEQITNWYMGKITLKEDRNENKFKPKAPPLKEILLKQIKSRVVTTKKYMVFIFVCMLRALGLQCRVMLNFVTIPIKPPSSELCSLSTKPKNEKNDKTPKNSARHTATKKKDKITDTVNTSKNKSNETLMQVDGNDDSLFFANKDLENIMQVDGNEDEVIKKSTRVTRATKNKISGNLNENEGSSPPKRLKKSPSSKSIQTELITDNYQSKTRESYLKKGRKSPRTKLTKKTSDTSVFSNQNNKIPQEQIEINSKIDSSHENSNTKMEKSNIVLNKTDIERLSPKNRKSLSLGIRKENKNVTRGNRKTTKDKSSPPKILINDENEAISSSFFHDEKSTPLPKKLNLSTKRSQTTTTDLASANEKHNGIKLSETKRRTKGAPGNSVERNKYFIENSDTNVVKPSTSKLNTEKKGKDNTNFIKPSTSKLNTRKKSKDNTNCIKPSTSKLNSAKTTESKDNQRISHRDLNAKTKNIKSNNDVTGDLISIIKKRVRTAKADTKKRITKEKSVKESDEDSDYLPEEIHKHRNSDSDNEFKPKKISPKPKVNRKIDRRVLSSDEDTPKKKTDVWCEVFVEELEQWITVDVIKGKVHCTSEIYNHASHPVTYIVGWNNNNNLKDLTRKYVPHWNTITRKQRVEPDWWKTAIQPWLGLKTARDKEEDEQLDRMQLEAPLPKSIAEYKNHPLYALKRHLLKFEAIYPPDAATLGFVRGEPVYARECVYVCRSRDTWLKEAKVVRMGEKPYKVVKARPKWDKLSNKLITDKPLEVFGPWQVQDYEPPVAENGVVPRNAYGNVELFKDCMLPKGTAHIKLPGLNKVARKLNIDCAPAMTGFEFNGGWSHPVYDGFVVCKEFEEIVTEAWIKDQEEQEKREREKIETRVYGNWKRLIKGLLIRERLKNKYGFEQPSHSQDKKKGKGPRLIVKKKY